MKKFVAAMAAVALILTSAAAHAGVVIVESETIDHGTGPSAPKTRTIMIEGQKRKIVTSNASLLIDLDAGTFTLIRPAEKAYIQMPFPPSGPMAAMEPHGKVGTLKFKKTGHHETVAGYPCDEYKGSGVVMGNQYSVDGCFSTKAPGASDFTKFQKAVEAKVKGTPMAVNGAMPDGVPLKLRSTIKILRFSLPGATPEQQARLKEMLAKRPPIVSDTTVTKVTEENIPNSEFVVPAGYTRQEIPHLPMGGGAPPAGSPPPNVKVPE